MSLISNKKIMVIFETLSMDDLSYEILFAVINGLLDYPIAFSLNKAFRPDIK